MDDSDGTRTTDRPAGASGSELPTEFDFDLPRGYVDSHGVVQTSGTMRLATARDELLPLSDDRVEANPPYLAIVLLARVITRLGTIDGDDVTPQMVESLFASDLAFLQDLYRKINADGTTPEALTCPTCGGRFTVDVARRR